MTAAPEELRPWHELPAEAAEVLRPELPALAREILAAIREEVPSYARPLDGAFGRGLTAGVEEALSQFLDGIEAGKPMPRSRVYVDLGRGEMRAGRSLEALLKAYRVGARVAWRRFSAAGVAARLDPEVLYALAESIFAYIDELSAKSAEGYAVQQSTTVGEQRAQRQRLVRLLVRDPPADPVEVAEVARAAEWRLPERLAALVFAEADAARVVGRLPRDVVSETMGDTVCALVPEPERPGRRAELARAVGTRRAALGPTVGWSDAALTLTRARAVLELAGEEGGGVLDAADYVVALLLHSDPLLAQELVRTRLAPLHALPAGARVRLTETLAAWLACQGRLQAVAEQLHVHPQTVRYRLGQLRELFGEALEDPRRRFELELALRAETVLRPPSAPAPGAQGRSPDAAGAARTARAA